MRLPIIKILSIFFCLVFLFSYAAREVFAIPTISGKVVLAGTGAALPNVWVKWMEDFGNAYQSAYRFAQTNSSGIYSFEDLSTLPPGQEKKLIGKPIDTDSNGGNDDVQIFVDITRPIPNASSGADEFFHFNAANSPHAFTAIVPSGLSGNFNTISNISINDADTSMSLPDIVFTPASIAATPTPAAIYSISGVVFNDGNKNGTKDGGETGYANATVTLSGDSTATVNSDASGNYSFSNLLAGSYTVAIVPPIGYNITTPSSSNITLTKNQTINFGLEKAIIGAGCTASVTGVVYNDLNWDGNLDAGETPIANWTVHLDALGLAAPLTATTNSSGVYTFTSLCTNIFTVTQTVSPPWFSTKSLSIVLIVIDGNAYTNINFFAAQRFTISGHAFLDPNGDGILTAGSAGFRGVTVILTGSSASGPLFRQVATPADGSYSFPNIPVGSYKLLFGKITDYRSTTANAVNIDLNNNQIVDYGLTPTNFIKVGGACNNSTLDIVMIIDHSGSMLQADLKTGRPKMDEAKEAASAFVDVIMRNLPTAKIGVVQFSDSDDFDINNTGDSYASSLLLPLTSDTSQLKTTITNISATGRTCVQCGVKLANKALNDATRPNSQKIIVFMTDGLANESADDPGYQLDPSDAENAAMVDIISGINRQNIIYHSIGLGYPGDGADNIDVDFLKAIANTNWGSYYNDPIDGDMQQIFNSIASKSVPTGGIVGTVYEDKDLSSSLTTGDVPIANMPLSLTGTNLPTVLTTTSDGSGNYGFYGLCDSGGKDYTISQNTISPWLLTTTGTYSIDIAGGALYKNNNFGNRYGYQISGTVFNDTNKNQLLDAGEQGYAGGITIAANKGTITTKADGTFNINGLLPGSLVVSYTSPLPKGFILIYPLNGPPPSFAATVGPACNVDGTSGALCGKNGDISSLNFSISNSIPWLQTYGLDLRFDNGFTDLLPAATTCGGGPYASGTNASFTSPGIVFSGDSSADFGQGSASSNNWHVGGISYPEVYSDSSGLKTSTKNLLSSAQKAGITIESLDSFGPCKNPDTSCKLQGLKKGFYHTTGDIKIDSRADFSNGNYVIIADGTITITKGIDITVTPGATALFAAGKDIIIDSTIHSAANACPVPAGQLQGIYSADRHITILGNNGNCLAGADKMLNIDGSLIVNAGNLSGKLQNQRDLCGDNPADPSLTISARPDFILNTPGFLTKQQTVSHEETP